MIYHVFLFFGFRFGEFVRVGGKSRSSGNAELSPRRDSSQGMMHGKRGRRVDRHHGIFRRLLGRTNLCELNRAVNLISLRVTCLLLCLDAFKRCGAGGGVLFVMHDRSRMTIDGGGGS